MALVAGLGTFCVDGKFCSLECDFESGAGCWAFRAGQGRAGQGRQGRAGQGRAGQGRAGQGRAGQGRAGQGRAGQGRAGQGRGLELGLTLTV